MVDSMRLVSSIYVDRSKSQWVVRDREGNLWIVPLTEMPGTIVGHSFRRLIQS